ncbi:response regulator transcription factor [Clostridium botulinum]|uniref:Stage 0 sporulation protein A homolog n=6 Tax=Clostridium botulinum TaxID=1491 RepID=A5HYP6_CLOBH|nr:response regulator transcription factor [Clostridium botulinum]KRU30118.1 signal transduction response regulator [Clostridium sporogenes]NFK36020.1 response regulator transcription factor [Clostridium botulinum H04402 065]ABS35346.1 DNA-binding response regulator [Clostridium botulinum A str. ATCC 19397]ABS36375.1 DNA-binding response regulator [Clostridium botulinum A str. Hall]ABS39757.1 DNA-binding response regulator [Clostridium botulinum F str. Langeland]
MDKILIVEDESSIRGFVKVNLKMNNFDVIEAETGEEGIEKARKHKPDVVVLDIMLPGVDGLEVCKTLRQEFPNMGIIMLTAKSQDTDKVSGLEYGADDYIIKPFNPLELTLRIKAILRRVNAVKESDDNIITGGPFKIDLYSKKIYKNEEEIDITPTEYLLMKIFIENPGKAFNRDELLDLVWGYDFMGDSKIVDVNIRRLRSKIEETPSEPKFIKTVWGTGYRWQNT